MADQLLLTVALLILVTWVASAGEMMLNGRRIPRLWQLPTPGPDSLPPLSVVVAARNEAGTVEAALQSLLELEYPDLEIIVVDDRSSDATGSILDRVASSSERLRTEHVRELPDGWLGKNHALALGAATARGEWLLFTDADVHFAPWAVARAVGHARDAGLHHLAVTPTLKMKGVILDLFAGAFALLFAQVTRPWRARLPQSRFHIGIGAFNLVEARAYRAVGGHEPIRMRPDDDLRLGRILKQRGFRQDLAFGGDGVEVEWYSTIGEAMRGLEKNVFAGVDYSLPRALLAGGSIFMLGVYPFVALLFTSGASWAVTAFTCLFILFIYAGSTRGSGSRTLLVPAFPLAAILVLFIAGRATALTVLRQGISWRGTFYSLRELRGGQIDSSAHRPEL